MTFLASFGILCHSGSGKISFFSYIPRPLNNFFGGNYLWGVQTGRKAFGPEKNHFVIWENGG